jgi:hypothetical protein
MDEYTVSLVFGETKRFMAFGGDNNILPKGFKVVCKRENASKMSKESALDLYHELKSKNLGESQIRVESTDFDDSI